MKRVRINLSPDAEEVYKHLVQQAKNSKLEQSILRSLEKESGVDWA